MMNLTSIPSSTINPYNTDQNSRSLAASSIDENASIDRKASGMNRYTEITRRLTETEKAETGSELGKVQEKDLALFERALEEGNWKAEIFKNEKYPYIALKAVREGLITEQQFATVMFYWVNAKDADITPIPLFNPDGSHNEEAKNIIRETLIINHRPDEFVQGSYLEEKQLNDLFDKMKKLPASEQHIFFDSVNKRSKGRTIMDTFTNLAFNIFTKPKKGRMIPSLGLMQTFLNVKFEDAVTINPVLGLSSMEDIRENGITSTRDMALRFPGVHLPDDADGDAAPGFSFTFHDFYHAYIASSLGNDFRCLFIKIGDIANEVIKDLPKKDRLEMGDSCVDMNIFTFRPEFRNHPRHRMSQEQKINDCFWGGIYLTYIAAKDAKKELDTMLYPTDTDIKVLKEITSRLPLGKEISEGPAYEMKSIDDQFNEEIANLDSMSDDDEDDYSSTHTSYDRDYTYNNGSSNLNRQRTDFSDDDEDNYDSAYASYDRDFGYSNGSSELNRQRTALLDAKSSHPLRVIHDAWQERIAQQKASV